MASSNDGGGGGGVFFVIIGIVVLTMEGMYWFEKKAILDVPDKNNTIKLNFNGGFYSLYGCLVSKYEEGDIEPAMEGYTRQQPTALVSEVLEIDQPCTHLTFRFFNSENKFLRFARGIPSLWICQILIGIIGCIGGLVMYLVTKKDGAINIIPLIAVEYIYVLIAMVIRPLGVVVIVRDQLGVTGVDWKYPFYIYLIVGLLLSVAIPLSVAGYFLVIVIQRRCKSKADDKENLLTDNTGDPDIQTTLDQAAIKDVKVAV